MNPTVHSKFQKYQTHFNFVRDKSTHQNQTLKHNREEEEEDEDEGSKL